MQLSCCDAHVRQAQAVLGDTRMMHAMLGLGGHIFNAFALFCSKDAALRAAPSAVEQHRSYCVGCTVTAVQFDALPLPCNGATRQACSVYATTAGAVNLCICSFSQRVCTAQGGGGGGALGVPRARLPLDRGRGRAVPARGARLPPRGRQHGALPRQPQLAPVRPDHIADELPNLPCARFRRFSCVRRIRSRSAKITRRFAGSMSLQYPQVVCPRVQGRQILLCHFWRSPVRWRTLNACAGRGAATRCTSRACSPRCAPIACSRWSLCTATRSRTRRSFSGKTSRRRPWRASWRRCEF